jgi:hypothetical protein
MSQLILIFQLMLSLNNRLKKTPSRCLYVCKYVIYNEMRRKAEYDCEVIRVLFRTLYSVSYENRLLHEEAAA